MKMGGASKTDLDVLISRLGASSIAIPISRLLALEATVGGVVSRMSPAAAIALTRGDASIPLTLEDIEMMSAAEKQNLATFDAPSTWSFSSPETLLQEDRPLLNSASISSWYEEQMNLAPRDPCAWLENEYHRQRELARTRREQVSLFAQVPWFDAAGIAINAANMKEAVIAAKMSDELADVLLSLLDKHCPNSVPF